MPLNTNEQLPFVGPMVIGEYFTYPGASSDSSPVLTLRTNLAGDDVPIKAILELKATDGAFVVPRMTFAEMNALDPVDNGSMVFVIDLQALYLYESAVWQPIASGPAFLPFTWTEADGPTGMQPNNGYWVNTIALTDMTLPTVCPEGDVMRVARVGAGNFSIVQNAGQQIRFETATTTLGVTGHIDSTNVGDVIEITCRVANLFFVVTGSQGALFNVV